MFLKDTTDYHHDEVLADRRFLAEARHAFLIRRPEEITASYAAAAVAVAARDGHVHGSEEHKAAWPLLAKLGFREAPADDCSWARQYALSTDRLAQWSMASAIS